MKKKSSEKITLSDSAYEKYYKKGNFFTLFLAAFVDSKSYWGLLFCVVIGVIAPFLVDISQISEPREFLKAISGGLITYSITVIGFLIVAFTLLIVLNSSQSIFHYFSIADKKYQRPLVSILLSAFLVPIGVFVLLLVVSLSLSFAIPVFGVKSFHYVDKVLIFKILAGTLLVMFIFSVLEFMAFFHNIFKFIVVSSYDASSAFEQETIKASVLPDLKMRSESDKELIEANARKKIEERK